MSLVFVTIAVYSFILLNLISCSCEEDFRAKKFEIEKSSKVIELIILFVFIKKTR